MKNQFNKILIWESVSLVFCLISSVINHFLYEWTNECALIAPYVPINESVWEHGKLLFMPFLFFSIIEFFALAFSKDLTGKCKINLETAKKLAFAKGIPLTFMVPLMITIFYTYSGIIGKNILFIDIFLALFIVVLSNWFSYSVLSKRSKSNGFYWIIPVVVIFIMFIVFTYFAPNIALFISSV